LASVQPSQGSRVTIVHQTDRPYESTVHATSGNCTLTGLTIAHRSPSVANNYAVFLQGASLTLDVWHQDPRFTLTYSARLLHSRAELANIALSSIAACDKRVLPLGMSSQ
jgi:hypothetical protein